MNDTMQDSKAVQDFKDSEGLTMEMKVNEEPADGSVFNKPSKGRGRPAKTEAVDTVDAQSQLQRNHQWATDLAKQFNALILVHKNGELVLDRDGVRASDNLNNRETYEDAVKAFTSLGF